MGMSQFEAALCLTLELIKHRTLLNHQVGNKFQRNIALQFFIACQPDNSHSASPKDLDQREAAKNSLSTGELTRRRFRDAARLLISHIEKISIVKRERKVKARSATNSSKFPRSTSCENGENASARKPPAPSVFELG